MPVLRRRETVQVNNIRQLTGAGTPVSRYRTNVASGSSAALAIGTQAMTEMAAEFGRAMGAESEEKAKALAKAAVFSTGPNGLPQLPPNVTEEMGEIARRTYNAAIEQRFAHQMTTAVRAQINDAQIANQYDIDAFMADATARLEGMSQDVPAGYEGMFQQISQGLMVDAGASVGWRQTNLNMQNTRESFPYMVQDARAQTASHIRAGDPEAAQENLAATIALINSQSPAILSDGDKARLIQEELIEVGWIALQNNDFEGKRLSELSPNEMWDLMGRLQDPQEDDPIWSLFKGPDGTPTPELNLIGPKIAGRVSQFLGKANLEASQAEAKQIAETRARIVRDGGAADTGPNRKALTKILAPALDLQDQSGNRRAPTMYDWPGISADPERRAKAVELIKDAGFADETLTQYLRTLERGQSPEQLTGAFLLLRDIAHQPNGRGQTVDLSGLMPDKVQELYGYVLAMHGDGDIFSDSIVTAAERLDLADQTEWDDNTLADVLNQNRGFFSGRVGRDEAQEAWRAKVFETVFDGVVATEAEKSQALKMASTYLKLEKNVDNALEMTAQSMAGRWIDSEFMGGRSSMAPEKHYAEAGPSSLGELLTVMQKEGKASGLDFAEFLMDFPLRPFTDYRVDFGAAEAGASPFEKLANQEIHRILSEMPEFERDARFPNYPLGMGEVDDHFFEPGMDQDYYLIAVSDSAPPVYMVMMRGPQGDFRPLPQPLDVREEFEQFRETEVSAQRILELHGNRAAQYATDWQGIADDLASGRNPSAQERIKRYHEETSSD